MNVSEVLTELHRNLVQAAAVAERNASSQEETVIFVQAAFLRAAVQVFGSHEKADFARAAKIAWDTVHKRAPTLDDRKLG